MSDFKLLPDMSTDELIHFGVKGMKWGVRKDDEIGVSAKTSREAKKDAQEYARAKMFYGQGAGTRRKLINASVDAKSKKDPDYKKAFDHHLAKQDMSKHASKARSERKRKNVATSTAKTARGVKNVLTRSAAPVTLTALAVATVGKSWYDSGGMNRMMNNIGNTKLADMHRSRQYMKAAEDLLRDMGMR